MTAVFEMHHDFTALTVVVVTHNFGMLPTSAVCYDSVGGKIPDSDIVSIVHTTTTTTITFTTSKTGTAIAQVGRTRVGDLRYSPDGKAWAIIVDNSGVVSTVDVSAHVP